MTDTNPQPQMIAPAPVPTIINTDKAQGPDGTALVVLSFMTPQGVNVFFISQDVARRLGVDLQEMGSEKRLQIASALAK